ncbi:polyprotein [Cucumis melo var. makuwa]|uniref:Polyprotein n=1 Tax=Cucumis melo var. makuwa TaxID=1194695 RepID=A0A5A7VIK8_CUCMM|nr:polyprotein [Cucumis melo var. makuwa]
MKLIKDYDCTIAYYPRKVNVIADALSRKSLSPRNKGRMALLKKLRGFKVVLNAGTFGNPMARFQVKPTLEEEIVRLQPEDPELRKIAEKREM